MEPRTCPHPTCGHTWTPRKAEPKKCPQCQNPLWTSPRPKRIKLGAAYAQPSARASEVRSGDEAFDSLVPAYGENDAPIHLVEKDSLSEAKARAEALIRQLA
jgi:hypothetical protein